MEKKLEQNLDMGMYGNAQVSERFAEQEQNEDHRKVSSIVDRIISAESIYLNDPLWVAELGGGAHPDRYNQLFARLLAKNGHIDWVDFSSYMLKCAERYIQEPKYKVRQNVISFIEKDIIDYLYSIPDKKLDLAIMKYTLNYIADSDIEYLFQLLGRKLKKQGRLVATVSSLSGELKSCSPHARFLYNGEEFPLNEIRTLKDGDSYIIKFLKETGNLSAGYIEGAQAQVFFHSAEKIRNLAFLNGFHDMHLGSWKSILPSDKETRDLDVLILRK